VEAKIVDLDVKNKTLRQRVTILRDYKIVPGEINEIISKKLDRRKIEKLVASKVREIIDQEIAFLISDEISIKLRRRLQKIYPPNIIYVSEQRSIPAILRALSANVQEFFIPLSGPCIYFLMREDRIVYVGQSMSIARRIPDHLSSKSFDRIYYSPVQEKEMDGIERTLIEYYDPEYNRDAMVNEKRRRVGLHERQRK
jgi:predicted GIY-YIG superfamily endonuclease